MLARGRGAWRYAAVAVLLALGAAACGSTGGVVDPSGDASTDPAEVASEAATDDPTDEPTGEPTDEPTDAAAPTDEEPADAVIEDGRHPTLLTALDETAQTVTFDLVQFLTGDEAAAAYAEDVPEDPDAGPPNDYWIRNVSARLRTLPIAPGATVTVLRPGGPEELAATLEELALLPSLVEGRIGTNPFWLTVEDGVVVAIEEQYLP
jgi:hypothetical protein